MYMRGQMKINNQTTSDADLIVVGAGAAGLLCGGFAGRAGLRVVLLDHSRSPGAKLLITGKGRCNVTNNCTEDDFITKVRTNPRFLYSALHGFGPGDTMAFFEARHVPLKTERGNRVFPVSDSAAQIVEALLDFVREGDTRLEQADCTKILAGEAGVEGVACRDGRVFHAPAVVLCTGGKSYPGTGSDGSGYRLAQALGHTLVEPRGSLVPLETEEAWCGQITGLSLRNVTLTLLQDGAKKPVYQELGEMLFTHFGISGPLVLTASSYMKSAQGYRILIDLKPGLDLQKLDARLLRDFAQQKNKDFANALGDLLPKSLIPVVVALAGIGGETKVHQITKEQRLALAALLKALPVTPKAFRPVSEAIVTAGGVQVKEVDPRTMESKLVPGLYFAGELLDVDGTTGGYNLQIAFSTGVLAARSIAAKLKGE